MIGIAVMLCHAELALLFFAVLRDLDRLARQCRDQFELTLGLASCFSAVCCCKRAIALSVLTNSSTVPQLNCR
jgi:hypothetical protein